MLQKISSVKSQFQLQNYPTHILSKCASPGAILSISVGLCNVDTEFTSGIEEQHQVVSYPLPTEAALRFGVLQQSMLTFEEPLTAI